MQRNNDVKTEGLTIQWLHKMHPKKNCLSIVHMYSLIGDVSNSKYKHCVRRKVMEAAGQFRLVCAVVLQDQPAGHTSELKFEVKHNF